MGKKSDAMFACGIIDEVDDLEANDWEETTREERAWMQTARELAKALIPYTGYVNVKGTSK